MNAYLGAEYLSDPQAVVPIKGFDKDPPTFSREHYRAGVSLLAPVYVGGRTRSQVTVAEFSKAISEARFSLSVQELVAEVTDVFNRMLFLRELITAQEETLAALGKARADTAIKVETGRVAPVDLMRMDTQIAEQQQALIRSREDRRRSGQTLALLLGWDPSRELKVEGVLCSPEVVPFEHQAPTQALDVVIEKRPDVRQAEEEVKRAEASMRGVRGLHLPSVDVVGDYGLRAGSGFEGGEDVWSAGVTLNLNLFSGGTISAQVREAGANLAEAREDLRQKKLNAMTEIRHALSSLREARHRLKVAESARLTAEETYRIEETRYRTGAGSVTDSLLAHAAWVGATANELAAVYDLQRASVAYRLALGTIDEGLEIKKREGT